MTTIALEGQGVTVAFGTTAFTSEVKSITFPEQAREAFEVFGLHDTIKRRKRSRIKSLGEFQMVFDWNPAAPALIDSPEETITITLPENQGAIAFSGFCTSEGGVELQIEQGATISVTIVCNSSPVHTPYTPPAPPPES
jgi:hypothetical protein